MNRYNAILFFTVFLLVIHASIAQQLNLNWAVSVGGSALDEGYSVTEDNSGNVYLTGIFSGIVDLNPSDTASDFRSTAGAKDIFLVKLDKNGNYLWGHTFGQGADDDSYSVITNSNGDVIIAGSFKGSVDFDPSTSSALINSNPFNIGSFIASYDANGNYRWVTNCSGSAPTTAVISSDLSIDSGGDIYMTGYYYGSIDLNTINGPDTLRSNGNQELYLIKLNDAGVVQKALSIGSKSLELGYRVTSDINGNVLLTGTFMDTVDFDPGIGIHQLIAAGSRDAFVLKLDPSLNFKWAINMGGGSSTTGFGIRTDQLGNVYSTGGFVGNVDFDPGPNAFILSASSIRFDSYVQKLDSNGNFIWAVSTGGGSGDYARDMEIDDSANLYISGYFDGTIDFNPGSSTNNLVSNSNLSTYVWKIDSAGNYLWANAFLTNSKQTFGSPVNSIFINKSGGIFLSGKFANTVDFDPGSGIRNISAMAVDAYAIKLQECQPIKTTQFIEACNSYYWPLNNQTYTSSKTASVSLTAHNGCDSVITAQITISKADAGLTLNGNTLTATQTGVAYKWLDCDDNFTIIAGETAGVFTPKVNGNYALEVSSNANCHDTSICYSVTTIGLEVKKMSFKPGVSPNPTKGVINLDLGMEANESIVNIRSIQGELLRTLRPTTRITEIELPFAKGLYYLEVIYKGSYQVIKVIKN